AADDNWQIDDCVRDADLKIAALEEHKRRLAAQLQERERQSGELVNQIKVVLDEASAAIRQQISELEQLLEREVTRAAQETTSVEAGLRAAREATAREARRMDAEIERLREIPNTFKAPGAAH
ncbi:MAG TPA: methyl-accepting chemotaxis protein, partial [Accumulibacter sp.]|nr:methyl-accepting chemotaxis protein [Accumulibacter sp.]